MRKDTNVNAGFVIGNLASDFMWDPGYFDSFPSLICVRLFLMCHCEDGLYLCDFLIFYTNVCGRYHE
jgi:hypothetical protein